MRASGVKRTLCLLSDAELQLYAEPLIGLLVAGFDSVSHVSLTEVDARRQCLKALCEAEASRQPVVMFCSTVMLLACI